MVVLPSIKSRCQWRHHGGMGGSGPPTFVQTPLEISTNPLKSFCIYGGCPMYGFCNFYCSPAKKNCSDTPLFLDWGRHCMMRASKPARGRCRRPEVLEQVQYLHFLFFVREWTESGQLWVQQVSSTPATRLDVVTLPRGIGQKAAAATGERNWNMSRQKRTLFAMFR